jgi:hypothetical protein
MYALHHNMLAAAVLCWGLFSAGRCFTSREVWLQGVNSTWGMVLSSLPLLWLACR